MAHTDARIRGQRRRRTGHGRLLPRARYEQIHGRKRCDLPREVGPHRKVVPGSKPRIIKLISSIADEEIAEDELGDIEPEPSGDTVAVIILSKTVVVSTIIIISKIERALYENTYFRIEIITNAKPRIILEAISVVVVDLTTAARGNVIEVQTGYVTT